MTPPGRNDPCPCGSGKKYKQCCLTAHSGATALLTTRAAAPTSVTAVRRVENTLYDLYLKERETFRWFEELDAESLRRLVLATWYIMLWKPADVGAALLRFYGHVIDGPNVTRVLEALKRRFACCEMYAWAIPNDQAIETLRAHSPLVEIGAGRGYWAALAAAAGADILAFDPHPPVKAGVNRWHRQPGLFFEVQAGDSEVVRMHPDRTLFLCWPPHDSDAALKTLRKYKGRAVIYVGDEGHDAGTPQFYAELASHFTREQVVEIPSWPGVDDRLEIWHRTVAPGPEEPA